MKEIIAVIRPNQWQKTRTLLMEEGFNSYTVHRVYGRGRQKGLQYLSKSGKVEEGIGFLPKRMVTILAEDQDVQKIVDILIKTNQTGEIGDGKIFISPLEEIQRIRTGEKQSLALA